MACGTFQGLGCCGEAIIGAAAYVATDPNLNGFSCFRPFTNLNASNWLTIYQSALITFSAYPDPATIQWTGPNAPYFSGDINTLPQGFIFNSEKVSTETTYGATDSRNGNRLSISLSGPLQFQIDNFFFPDDFIIKPFPDPPPSPDAVSGSEVAFASLRSQQVIGFADSTNYISIGGITWLMQKAKLFHNERICIQTNRFQGDVPTCGPPDPPALNSAASNSLGLVVLPSIPTSPVCVPRPQDDFGTCIARSSRRIWWEASWPLAPCDCTMNPFP